MTASWMMGEVKGKAVEEGDSEKEGGGEGKMAREGEGVENQGEKGEKTKKKPVKNFKRIELLFRVMHEET